MKVAVAARSPRVEGRELLVCAVLRDDLIPTRVTSGENANKTLTARFPARSTKFEFIRLDDKSEKVVTFPFRLDRSWKTDRLSVVAFVQDKQTGVIHQAAAVPWKPKSRD